jgi:hypothetical protein
VVEHRPQIRQPVADFVGAPADSAAAAIARLRFARSHGFKVTDNELHDSFSLTRTQVTKVRQAVFAESNGHNPE